MQQITSYHQVQELKVGSILIQKTPEYPVQFSILSCTPIGWEDIEFELSPLENGSGHTSAGFSPGILNRLGSEFVSEHFWWVQP